MIVITIHTSNECVLLHTSHWWCTLTEVIKHCVFLLSIRYTKQDASHEVETSLELWYSSGSQSAPYSILLMQKKAKSSTVFVLHESDKQQEAQDAFGEVLSKVGPFVENGNVMPMNISWSAY